MTTPGHRGSQLSRFISSAQAGVVRADSGFNRLNPKLQAVLKGSVQTLDLMLTIKLQARDGSLQNLQFIPEHPNMLSLYHDAIQSGQEPEIGAFGREWETWKEKFLISNTDPYNLSSPVNSVEHLLQRGGGDIAVAWANEEMSNGVLYELGMLLFNGFKAIEREDQPLQTLMLCVLLQRLSKVQWCSSFRDIFQQYLLDNMGRSFIAPMFSPLHAAYVTVQPSTSRSDLFRVTVCNGGHASERFSKQNFTNRLPYETNFRGHCVILADFKHTQQLFLLLGSYWMTEEIFSEVADFIGASLAREKKRCGARVSSVGKFFKLDETELLNGRTAEIPDLSIRLATQYQGNCTVFNLFQALAMCNTDGHRQPGVKCTPYGAAVHESTAILCRELLQNRAELEPVVGTGSFRTILLSLVRQILQYELRCDNCSRLGHTVYERDSHNVSATSDPGLYCIGPGGMIIVTGERPENGWNGGADTIFVPLSSTSPLLALIIRELEPGT